ncbi:Ligand-gated ion channel [Ancylostoma ceylanicum]|uniref:Ligand-gated ion channel n=1 Tax=Ancylostoma ceylanicum TaxID=53326 RepID=A0A0D6LJI6_9BILA|nr:Ligand-gated ion channel [Ancylostoma ceylanicum]
MLGRDVFEEVLWSFYSFGGKFIRRTTNALPKEEPFVTKNSTNHYEGFCIDLLNEMAAILKFNYTIIEVQDGSYGIEDETGRWNGIIGVLQRHEADLSVSAVTITYSRVEVVDFTLPFMHLGISILLARAKEDSEKSSLFTFLEPLSLPVWVSLIGAYLSVSFTMYLLARFSPYEWYDIEKIDERDRSIENQKNQFSVLNSLWFAVGSLMQQGSDVIPRAAATRVVAVIWWMFTQILISSYTAQLAAFLTVERMSTPIESTADLASQQKIRYGTLKSGSTMDFFRESRIPIYERMWSVMESSSPPVFVNSSKEGIARVKAGNYAYMMESSMLEYYMERDCQLQSIGGLLDSKGYGIALPKGSPLRDLLSRTVLQLQERTILEALKNKWWRDMREGPSCAPPAETSRTSPPQSIFYVLITGLIIAMLMAFGEYCIESRHDSFRLKLTVLGKMRDWWLGLSGAEKAEKARNKLRNMQLDTAGQPFPNLLTPPSGEEQVCVVRDGSRRRTRAGSTISREGLRRLSRMLPANHEQLIHLRLRDKESLSEVNSASQGNLLDVKTRL